MICRLTLSIILIFSGLPVFAEPCIARAPTSTAEWLYRHNADLLPPKESVRAALSKELFELLKKERECVERTQEVCAIDADLWTNTQDGGIWGAVHFEQTDFSPTSATVVMKYKFAIYEDGRDARDWVTTVFLTRVDPKACWVVGDIVGPDGLSLKKALRANE